ncbi:uncharacterized protein LOC125006455 [Mugil cephalus]|uniref:uncharacterized protein LOC125006455 n=1 Tax=Mugil cephalus TaxID=48193 RepID=UPI001FB85737|nr:uncharacterized protein LOC125006455 [Mugil cephalus]
MKQKGVHLDRKTFSCSICLDVLKDPVTIPCGHSYCMNCIKTHWDGEDQKGIYSCPQCRKTFIPRPVLEKNTMLAELVEQLKKTGLQAAPADHCYAGPEDVVCDVCTGRKRKASKSCLVCLASYCEKHLQPHHDAPPFKKHKLEAPSKKLQENICSRHDEVMKIFCRTDQQIICYLCTMDEHKGHETVPAAAERTEKQKEVEVMLQNILQGIQERKKDVELLRQELKAIKDSADKTVKDSKEIFTEMIRLLQERSSDMMQPVRSQQETEESVVKDLKQEIIELERKGSELKQLINTEDHNQFLQNYPTLPPPSESTHSSSIKIRPRGYFAGVKAAVIGAREKLQDILRETWTNISVTEGDVLLSQPEPKTRDEFLKYSRKITLDPTTAHKWLSLSKGNRKVTKTPDEIDAIPSYYDHSNRFAGFWQVLSRESLTGRCYWEVEWSGKRIEVAVAYKDISRTRRESEFGFIDKSWSLYCYTNHFHFVHNNVTKDFSGHVSSRIGVYLDHRAGLLSFYSVSETMTLLHRVRTTFTQPLYAGLRLSYGVTAELIKIWTSFTSRKQKLTRSLTLRGEMEQKGVHLDRKTFSCSICLDLLKDPVTIPCGHSYCMNCIKSHWDGEDQKGIYSCPQCRKTFIPRPVLEKNTMLAELVEQLKKTGLQAAPADHCYAGPEDVACDVCTGRKLKAFKSCLVCLASYCEKHLQPHYDAAPFKKHKLVEPSKKLQENICSRHDEVMKVFCRTDQQSICYLCLMNEHKGHETVPVAAERTEKQKEVEVMLQNILQGIQERKTDVELLRIDTFSMETVEDSEEIFTEMIRLLQKRSSDVEQLVRSQQETEESRVKDVEEKLEQQITELERKGSELKQLLNTEDHNQFLHNYPSLPPPSESTHSSSIKIRPLRYFKDVKAAVTETREKLQDILRETWTNISATVTEVDILLPQPEPKTRDEFLKYSRKITLDPNTAHTLLLLSEGNRKITRMYQPQSYSDHPDRFIGYYPQVLSRTRLTGRCYWEVEWRGGERVNIAVAYKNISRTKYKCDFGSHNDISWSLRSAGRCYRFSHKTIQTRLSGPASSRVGVYLDHRAGILSFYSVSETMNLIHRVQDTFTQPLYAGLCLLHGSAELIIRVHIRVTSIKQEQSFTLRGEMEQKGVHLDRETFSCSICLDPLKDPVTTSCGHSYCMNCIKSHWDEEDQKRIYSCPQCRKTFIPRPVLEKNTMLAELVEQLKKTGLQAAPADHCYAGPEDVVCDVCTGRKLKAFKSCLVCLASYCEKHLQPHYDVAPFKKHKLVEPSKKLQENICSRHDEVMKVFCRTDQQSICYLCSVDEHKGHETVSAAAERTEKQKEVEVMLQNILQGIQERKKDVELLGIDTFSMETVEDSEEIFTEMIRLLQKRSSDVEQLVRSQQETEESRVKDVEEKLEQQITELERKGSELKQLLKTEDHNQFLHNYHLLPPPSESTHSSSIKICPLRYFKDVKAAVTETREKLQDILRETWTNISVTVTEVDVLLSQPEPKTRDEFWKYSRQITLDPNTANILLLLSEGNRKVTSMNQPQSYFHHPDRFTDYYQVLSRESLTGRCYWEVEWRGEGGVGVAVAYKNIRRAGELYECWFGSNDKSWSFYCSTNSNIFFHNKVRTDVSGPVSSRIGVYLDHRAGLLSFYSVSETMTLLHRVQTTFTQPLYAGLRPIFPGSTAELIKVK